MIHAVDGEKLKPYPSFNPFIYSLDTFLPIVDLRQKGYCLPNAHKTVGLLVQIYLVIHIICGWILTTLWVAGFSGLIRGRE
jgi:hypothetical protein